LYAEKQRSRGIISEPTFKGGGENQIAIRKDARRRFSQQRSYISSTKTSISSLPSSPLPWALQSHRPVCLPSCYSGS